MSSLASLAIALALMATTEERIVCVPASSGSGWECGKGEQAPAARSLPRAQQLTPSAPPPYLMDPASLPSVAIEPPPAPAVAAERNPAPQPEPALSPEPMVEPAPEPQPTPLPEPQPAPIAEQVQAPEPAPDPVAAPAPEPAAAPTPEPVAAAEPVARPETDPVPAPMPAPSAEPVSTPTPPAVAPAAPVARIVSSVARDAADLLALPGTGYTVQLAAASGLQGFTTFRQKLGIAVEDTFVIRVRRGSEDWWLMLWRDFPDLDSARSAAATLSAHGNFWPRRLAPLQGEVRATPN